MHESLSERDACLHKWAQSSEWEAVMLEGSAISHNRKPSQLRPTFSIQIGWTYVREK